MNKIEKIAKNLVANDILCNISSEVEYIIKQDDYKAPFTMEDIVNICDEDDNIQEVMQWYKVSSSLCEYLTEMGEVTIPSSNIWGRCGCGYSLEEDMYRVARYLRDKTDEYI